MRSMVWVIVALAMAQALGAAAPQLLLEQEAETLRPPETLSPGVTVVEDPLASEGKALRIAPHAEAPHWNLGFGLPAQTLAGRVYLTLHCRGEGMLPISHGLNVVLVAHDRATGTWAHSRESRIYGTNLREGAYLPVRFALDLSWEQREYPLEVLLRWEGQPEGVSPALYLDKVEVSRQRLDTPAIVEAYTERGWYRPGEQAAARVVVHNPLPRAAEVTVIGEEHWGLEQQREAFRQTVTAPAETTVEVSGTWRLGQEEYGRELVARLVYMGRETDTAGEVFVVHSHPLWCSVGNGYDRGSAYRDMHTIFYVEPATVQQTLRSLNFHRRLGRPGGAWEFFSWAPGDISDLAPQEDPFPGGEGRITYRSRETIRMQTRLLKERGYWPVSYVNGTVWAESGYRLFQERPEWFLYDANGEVAHYSMERRELYRRKDDLNFDPNEYPVIFFQATLNHALPEVQEYIAEQFIAAGEQMGFKGVRMDVRYLEVYPGERDFWGKEVAPTYEEADRISAAAIQRVKALVRRRLPDFTFGYNYASPEETREMPLSMQERCREGGWMLDEVSCTYQAKTSPYHVWEAYLPRMVSWGDQVRKWGGIYDPFDFRRGGANYVVDNIYSAIIRLIASGRFSSYHNSRLPFGDLGRLGARHAELLLGKELSLIPEVRGEVEVRAQAPVWWRNTVFWSKSAEGRRRLIVHLLNPPLIPEVEENPKSELRPPVREVEVLCAPVEGQAPRAAYLVSAEPQEPWEEARRQMVKLPLREAGGGKVAVTAPSVLFWKMVIFEW